MLVTIVYRSIARLNKSTVNACPDDVNSVILQHPGEDVKLVVNDNGAFLLRKGQPAQAYEHANKATLVKRYAKYMTHGITKGNQLTLTV